MPSNAYSVQELLSLRDLGVPIPLTDVPQKGAAQASQPVLPSRQIGSESRTLGRFHKFRPYHAQETGTVRTKGDFPTAFVPSEEVDFARQQPTREHGKSAPADIEWRYRGRTGSEAVPSTEPLSAPAGVNAQQSEGFQRFFKAVISPTHVRVTAGGRIVPNTRGTSPMSKHLKDRDNEGGHIKTDIQQNDDKIQQPADLPHPAELKAPNMPLFAYPSHPFYPPFSAPLPGMPMMPMPMGLGLPSNFPFSHQQPYTHNIPHSMQPELARALSKENQQNGEQSNERKGERRDVSEPETTTSYMAGEKARRVSSGQFDQFKPFVLNGQVIYPFPAPGLPPHLTSGSHQLFPPGFVGQPGFPVTTFHNPLLGAPPIGMNQMLNPTLNFSAMPGQFQLPPANTNTTDPPTLQNVAATASSSNISQPPTAPPVSSIRPSEISRKQIEMLRSSLKYHEDQLLYNKHQIDEKEMEHTIRMLQSQIDRFEALNQSQLRFEESHYPKKECDVSEPDGPRHFTDKSSQASAAGQGSMKRASSNSKRPDSLRQKHFLRRKEQCFGIKPTESSVTLTDPVKKSTLPSGAALAPPFEPRSLFNDGNDKNAASKNTAAAFRWNGTVVDDGTYPHNTHHRSAGNSAGHGNSRSSSFAEKASDLGKPYLVGTLPQDIDPQKARDSDYIYERELTQDETRSRYLFWGKAPSFTRKGLPKFDGKDFYPPSPNKDQAHESSKPPPLSRRVPIGDPSVDFFTNAIQPKSTPFSRPSVTDSLYTPSFARERQKPVKVTLRRPDVDTSSKAPKVSIKPSRTAESQIQVSKKGCRDRTDTPTDNTRTKFLHTVLRRNISSNSEVLPNTITSATVHGVIPQYTAGYNSLMAASLSPINSSPVTIERTSPGKSDEGSSIFLTPASRKTLENHPPPDSIGPASLENQFHNYISLEGKHNASLPAQWSAL